MKNKSNNTDFDVIQIGYGPVSKISALLLARQGWKVGVFERWGEVYPLPRAVCIDHEIFRMMHAAGLGPIVDRSIQPAPAYRWYNADWKELLMLDWPAGSVSGSSEVNFVHQPSLEKELDAEVKRRNNIFLHFDNECIDVAQNESRVSVDIKDLKSGKVQTYSAKYLIGIDGANSFVRKSQGITQLDLGFDADWLVVDFMLNNGLTASDLGLVECGQYCNPERPTTIVPGGKVNGREYRRWEFMRLPHESKEEMVSEEKVQELLGDWIKPEQGELIRHALYTFRSLITDQWRNKRVLLAGDAAHLMPPFMGQGMCAGLRDVWNLSWKLDRVLKGEASDTLLDSYEAERKPHATEVIKLSMFLGSIICIPDKAEAKARDEQFLSENAPQMAPFPWIKEGIIAKDATGKPTSIAGRLSPHGTVRYQRRTGRLDHFIDMDNFSLMVNASLPLEDMSASHTHILKNLNVQIIKFSAKESATDNEFADTQGQILGFMYSNNINAMLVRPDHYIFGTASTLEELEELVETLESEARLSGIKMSETMQVDHV
ncbi:bifunctional 3-(3-hydroxy-phenyl)propionate/3-hydroxycinnamic acid hydroxylase [Neptunomonas sp.]